MMRKLTPSELFGEIADEITQVVKKPYRLEPVTDAELDTISDRILMLFARIKQQEVQSGSGNKAA